MGICNGNKTCIIHAAAFLFLLGSFATCIAASVQLQWDPNVEADLSGYKVYYGPDSSPLTNAVSVDVHNQTEVTITGLDPSNAYSFAVTAYNAAGQESSFSNIVTSAEQVPPTVAITSPTNSSTVSGAVSVNVSAADNVGVTRTEYYVNNVLLGTEITTPYSFSWNTSSAAPGINALTVRAYDAAGNVNQSTNSVTVVIDVIGPDLALTSPVNSSVLSGIVTVNASASDNVAVTEIEYYCNGILIYAGNLSPYSFNWDTRSVANGGYTLVAKAYDNAGNSTQSSAVAVSVNNYLPITTEYNLSDALLALQIGSGKVVPTAPQVSHLDVAPVVNGRPEPDGEVNTGDAIVILSKVAGHVPF